MPPPSNLIAVIREWLAKADLQAAAHLLALKDECPADVVCFHSQQCVEKYIKALLVFQGTPFPKTHNIRAIRALLPPKLRPKMEKKVQDGLTRHATILRYPGGGTVPTLADARKAVAIARKVRKEVRSHLPPAALRREKK